MGQTSNLLLLGGIVYIVSKIPKIPKALGAAREYTEAVIWDIADALPSGEGTEEYKKRLRETTLWKTPEGEPVTTLDISQLSTPEFKSIFTEPTANPFMFPKAVLDFFRYAGSFGGMPTSTELVYIFDNRGDHVGSLEEIQNHFMRKWGLVGWGPDEYSERRGITIEWLNYWRQFTTTDKQRNMLNNIVLAAQNYLADQNK